MTEVPQKNGREDTTTIKLPQVQFRTRARHDLSFRTGGRRYSQGIDVLARQPLIGEACLDLGPGLHNFSVRPYVIYYCIQADEVTIVRVLHGDRDVRRQI